MGTNRYFKSCKECNERTPDCHSHCESYITARRNFEENKKKYVHNRQTDAALNMFFRNREGRYK